MYKAKKTKLRLTHIPVTATDKQLDEIAAKIRKAQQDANTKKTQ